MIFVLNLLTFSAIVNGLKGHRISHGAMHGKHLRRYGETDKA
jgi:hypothetical protein